MEKSRNINTEDSNKRIYTICKYLLLMLCVQMMIMVFFWHLLFDGDCEIILKILRAVTGSLDTKCVQAYHIRCLKHLVWMLHNPRWTYFFLMHTIRIIKYSDRKLYWTLFQRTSFHLNSFLPINYFNRFQKITSIVSSSKERMNTYIESGQ